MRIGIDTSGKFSTASDEFTPTVLAAAVGTDAAFEEVATWTAEALARWGLADRLDELHAKELRSHRRLEICRMLSDRADIRLAAVATDPGLLGSAEAVNKHRRRQRDKAASTRPGTEEGLQRRRNILSLLDNEKLHDDEYLLAAGIPQVLMHAAQRAFCFFESDDYRADMSSFVVLIDEEAAPTMRYADGSLMPILGGDDRFSIRVPEHWRDDPTHPLLERIRHPERDGLRPQLLFDDVRWVSSAAEPAVQIADLAAWTLARRIKEPTEPKTAECFELLKPLLVDDVGRTLALFSVPPIREDQEAMYRHLQYDSASGRE